MNIWYDTNTTTPTAAGLLKLGQLDEDLSYEYNTLLVIEHQPTGKLFYAVDSGCSCPTPFDDFFLNSPDDTNMIEITLGDSFASFQREVEGFPVPQGDRDQLLSAVKTALEAPLKTALGIRA